MWLPLAVALGGVALALGELGWLAAQGRLAELWAHVVPAAGRLALLGMLVGVAAVPVEWALGRGTRRWRVVARGAVVLGLAAGAAACFVLARNTRLETGTVDSQLRYEQPILVLAIAGALIGALGVVRLGGVRLRAVWIVLLVGAAVAAVVVDPADLRGSYLSLDLGLFGAAFGALAAAALLVLGGARTRVAALLVIAAVGAVAFAWPSPRGGVSELLVKSPRLRAADRVLGSLGLRLPEAESESSAIVDIDERELFLPPGDPAEWRARWRERRSSAAPLSILWVTLDALRPELTGVRGGRATPELDRLAAGATIFTHAFSQAPGTGVSVESMFTSRYPGRTAVSLSWEVGEDRYAFDPLPMILERAGYRTLFVTGMKAATLANPQFRLVGRGFAERRTSPGDCDAAVTAQQALEAIADCGEQPFFCWTHLFDAHYPYVARLGTAPDAPRKERWESEVRYADRALGEMLRGLERLGRADSTIVVVHADHAEAFGEHGRYFHATSYFDTQIHVPLVIHVPGISPARIGRPVGNVDLPPTLLELVGEPVPDSMQGSSLLPVLLDPSIEFPRVTFAETLIISDSARWPGDRIRVATDGRWKLIEYLSDGFSVLFDRDADPLEQQSLADARPEVVARLRGYLAAQDRWLAEDGTGPNTDERIAGWDEIRILLRDADPKVRSDTLQGLVRDARRDVVADLEDAIGELPPDTAHKALILLDTVLLPPSAGEPVEAPLPAEADALRYRLIQRYARASRYWSRELPTPGGAALLPIEELALTEARAARGSAADIAAIKEVEPASRTLWAHLAPILAVGGDAAGQALVAGELFSHQSGLDDLLRGLRVLAAADAPLFTQAVGEVWPSPEPRLDPRRREEVVTLAISQRHRGHELALIALHPGANPKDQRRIEAALAGRDARWTPELTARLGELWAQARFLGRNAEGAEALRAAVALAPEGGARLAREAEWVETPRDVALVGALRVAVSGVAATPAETTAGPPELTLSLAADGRAPLGPGGLPVLALRWVGSEEVPAGRVWFPRAVLDREHPWRSPVALDYPITPGTWRLSAPAGAVELLDPETAPVYRVEATTRWEGAEIARLSSFYGPPLRVVGGATVCEVVTGGRAVLRLPAREIGPGKVRVAVDAVADFGGDTPYVPLLEADTKATIRLPQLRSGVRQSFEGQIEVSERGLHVLSVVWPDRRALVSVFGVEVSGP